MSSMMGASGGPGGLTGGDFSSNANLLMGHDFSADLVGSSLGGVYTDGSGSKGQSQYGIDTSRFDTSEYQNMVDQLFNPQTYDKELLASPFHGETSQGHSGNGQGQGQSYETSHESSIGSYAATDMSASAYSANSGSYQSSGSYSTGQGYGGGAAATTGSGATMAGNSDGSSGTVHSPFDTSGFLSGGSSTGGTGTHASTSLGGSHSELNLASPFKISDKDKGESPFKITNVGQGANPFDTSSFLTGAGFGSGQSQTDFQSLSGGQSYQGGDGLTGETQFQINSGTTNKNGLDQYGNIDFSKLSGLTGSGVNLGTSGTQYGSVAGTGSGSHHSGSSYASFTGSKPSYTGVNTGVSESQYKTPFESENYNDLLGNPFDSSSDFNSNHENFNQPFSRGPDQSGGLQAYQGSSGSLGTAGIPSYLGSSGYAQQGTYDQGPAGNPFHQGGSRMNQMRGRNAYCIKLTPSRADPEGVVCVCVCVWGGGGGVGGRGEGGNYSVDSL